MLLLLWLLLLPLLQTALEVLGLPCYHMVTIIERGDVSFWYDAADGGWRCCVASTLNCTMFSFLHLQLSEAGWWAVGSSGSISWLLFQPDDLQDEIW
jgi:hypothetical protein